MTARAANILKLVALGAMLVVPWATAAVVRRVPPDLWVLPPPVRVLDGSDDFSWLAFLAMLVALFALGGGLARAWKIPGDSRKIPTSERRSTRPFPGWGMAAAAWTAAWWAVAWTRYPVFSPVQRYTFFPLWLGFIVTVNAVVWSATGRCGMLAAPKRWFGLFLVSGLFWWSFEWFNRFVQNWHYLGVDGLSATTYAVHATLSFSTVLPAVAAVAELLSAVPRLSQIAAGGPALRWLGWKLFGVALILVGLGLLGSTSVWPLLLYPSLWSAPLLVMSGVEVLSGQDGRVADLARGQWHDALAWMLAALICGGFWETWNVFSWAKWTYSVPGLNRWHVFEMPLLGYCGYVTFGLECLLVAERILPRNTANR